MPIDWSHDYGFDGWMGYRDAENERSYILGAEDGTLQAVLNEDGTIQAAGGNIIIDRNGIVMHDLAGASFSSPIFGIGVLQDVNDSSESFDYWDESGTASVSANDTISPDGINQTADTLSFPAVNDGVYNEVDEDIANGVTSTFSVWLKAATDGIIRLRLKHAGTDYTQDTTITTSWRRYAFTFTNDTGSPIVHTTTDIYIERADAGHLDEVKAWGAQLVIGYDFLTPYAPDAGSTSQVGVYVRGAIFASDTPLRNILLLNSITSTPTGRDNIVAGIGSGQSFSGDNSVIVGRYCGDSTSVGDGVILLGSNANATSSYQAIFGGIREVYFGVITHSTPENMSINVTGGSGTNIAGADLTLAGGKGTGSGAGGSLLFKTAPAGASGSSLNSLATAFEITGEGTLDFKNSPVVNFSGGGGGSVNRWRLMFGA